MKFPRKETLVTLAGIAGIAGIFAFYGGSYIRSTFFNQDALNNTNLSLATSSSTASDEASFISYDALAEKMLAEKDRVIFIDIRPINLFVTEHIPQSTHVAPEAIGGWGIKPGFTTIIITTVGNEQGFGISAAQALNAANPGADVRVLRGGFEAWKQLAGRTISIGNPTLRSDYVKVTFVEPEVFKKRLDAKQAFLILDMRSKEDYAKGHVPGAVNLPLDQLEADYGKIPLGVRIVAYGGSELEDFQAGVRLFDLGFFSTEILKGGAHAWELKKLSLEK